MKLNAQTKRMFTEANQVSTGKTYVICTSFYPMKCLWKYRECNGNKKNDNIEHEYMNEWFMKCSVVNATTTKKKTHTHFRFWLKDFYEPLWNIRTINIHFIPLSFFEFREIISKIKDIFNKIRADIVNEMKCL